VGSTDGGWIVAASWLRVTGCDRVPLPIHVWLTIEGLGTRKLHTPGTGSVAILEEPPHEAYELDDGATVEVERGTPALLGARVGQAIEAASTLWQEPPGMQVGFILKFRDGGVGIVNLGDDLVIKGWPDAAWSEWGVSRMN
jgi:hypothetical protein